MKSIHQIDDFDRAEKSIFDKVEFVEKVALNSAINLIHDEVQVLFGKDHGGSLHHHDEVQVQVPKKHIKKMKNMSITNKGKGKIDREMRSERVEEINKYPFPSHTEISDCFLFE